MACPVLSRRGGFGDEDPLSPEAPTTLYQLGDGGVISEKSFVEDGAIAVRGRDSARRQRGKMAEESSASPVY